MRVKALVGFASLQLSLGKGQEADITDQEVLNDLLSSGYVESIEESKAPKKTARKKVVKDESK